jgi:AraC-like DNA-binding protein
VSEDFARISFHTPTALDAVFPYHVVAAGRTVARPDEAPIRRRYNQHVLILTLSGRGEVAVNGRLRGAEPGTIAWLNTTHDYFHRCDARAGDWRYAWLGIHGFGLDEVFASVADCASEPVTRLGDGAAAEALFAAVLGRMESRPADQSAANSADVARLMALILTERSAQFAALPGLAPVERVVLALREGLARPWRIGEMARLAELSPSQLHRLFRRKFGLTPMNWLRAERINAAKRMLTGPDRPIAAVAEAVGYPDPYHFSRDFRALTQRSPSLFRQEGGA